MPRIVDDALLKSRIIQPHQYFLKNIDAADRAPLIQSMNRLDKIEFFSNPQDATRELHNLDQMEKSLQLKYAAVSSFINHHGIEVGGSTLKRLYPNPFAPYAFVADNWWAAWKARREMRVDLLRDGYVIVSKDDSKATKRRVKLVSQILDDLRIGEFIANMVDHLNAIGNCWIVRETNQLGGAIEDLTILLPESVIPKLDKWGERVVAWEYCYGNRKVLFNKNELDHVRTYSMRSLDLGTPALQPLLIDIETCMYASQYSHTMFKKGGLLKALVSLDQMEDPSVINDGLFGEMVERIQEIYERTYSGVKGSGGLMFLPGVHSVHNLVNPKDLEGAHKESMDSCAMRTAEVLGCSPERIGLSRSSQYQNQALIDDSVALSFDNNQYYLVELAHNYVNRVILNQYLNVDDLMIHPAGEYGSVSKTASEFGMNIAQMGCDVMTVNEFRMKVLHWEPLEGPDGEEYIGNITNEANMQSAIGSARPSGTKERLRTHLVKHRKQEIVWYD